VKTALRTLRSKLAVPVVLMAVAMTVLIGGAQAVPGQSLGVVVLPGNGGCSVGGSFDGTFYITVNTNSCQGTVIGIYKPPPTGAGPATLISTKAVVDGANNPVTISAVDWDAGRGLLWGVFGSTTGRAWLINLGDKTMSGTATATLAFNYNIPGIQLIDGLAHDFILDQVHISPDVSAGWWSFKPDGTPMGMVTVRNANNQADGLVSGLAIGASNTMYVARNGTGEIRRVNKSTGAFVSSFATTNFRVEDLTCDQTTYAPKEAILAKDAFGSSYEAFEVEPGTCPQIEQPVEADKEVTDLILDDGSGFPDREGAPLNCKKDPTLARTTRCSMVVEVSTNPIISVVSLDQNNGPDDTESDITFMASIDDGHAPGHVEGAYIRDAGSPKGLEPDELTCFSLVNPDNPLEQRLNPCPHEEKILGDGDPRTVESDLHFQLFEEARQRDRILRFFKLHCLVGGQHTITFYNKAEPKEPTQDPNLDNNWWRAILDLTCVTPGKVTGGGKIDPDGTVSGLASLLITSGANAGHSATFGFVIEFESGDPFPTGELEYNDHDTGDRIKALDYATLAIVGCTAEFTGTADVNGTMEPLRVKVFDGGEPGSEDDGSGPDTFEIDTATYDAAGMLIGGNIQIHNGNPC
jgi:hypothetical protein